MSLLIGDKLVVSMNYTLTDDDGQILDSSDGGEPLNYLHGAGNIIPGLENAMVGKAQGDKFDVRVEPAEGYGEVNPQMIQVVPRAAFQGVEAIEPGMQFQAEGPDGQGQLIRVAAVDGDDITVDANHPLAGQVLNFAIEVVGIREASEEEIAHGHVH